MTLSTPVIQDANQKEMDSLEALWASKAAYKKQLQAECQLIEFTTQSIRHPPNVKLCGSIGIYQGSTHFYLMIS